MAYFPSTTLNAGENHIGSAGGNMVGVSATPTLTVHDSYASGDFVGTSGTAITFADCARLNGGTGIIQSATLVDYAAQAIACELWLFDATVTPPNDSAAWTISDADAAKCIGVIAFTNYYSSALNSVSVSGNVGIAFKTASAATALYGCLVTRGAPTYADGDLTIRLVVMQD